MGDSTIDTPKTIISLIQREPLYKLKTLFAAARMFGESKNCHGAWCCTKILLAAITLDPPSIEYSQYQGVGLFLLESRSPRGRGLVP